MWVYVQERTAWKGTMWWTMQRKAAPNPATFDSVNVLEHRCGENPAVQEPMPLVTRNAFGLTEAELDWLQLGVQQAQLHGNDDTLSRSSSGRGMNVIMVVHRSSSDRESNGSVRDH